MEVTHAKVVDACIKLVVRDTAENRDFGVFSGVIISPDGLVVTAAHSVTPGHRYRVELPSGEKAVVVALGKIALENAGQQYDLAMLKLEGKSNWPYAVMADNRNMIVGEGCVAISYPGTFFQTKPNLRFGLITRLKTDDGFIASTCKMEPGDSGGGLFDLNGKLIGIRDKIDVNEDANFDIPVNLFKQYRTALLQQVNYQKLPPADPLPAQEPANPIKVSPIENFAKLKKTAQDRVFTLNSIKNGVEQHILTTPVLYDVKEKSTVLWLSKSSMVGENPSIMHAGVKSLFEVIARDTVNDLVLMKAVKEINGISGISLANKKQDNLTNKDLGKFLISPTDSQTCKIGVISTLEIELPLSFSQAKLGALVQEESGKLTVSALAPGFPAEKALKVGDQIIGINGKKVSDGVQYFTEMKKVIIGDRLKLDIIRQETSMTVEIAFPERSTHYYASAYQGGRSFRSDGFKKVFAQDAAVRSDECGGPVYDIDGNFVGINIARHSRTATIILPLGQIRKSIMNVM